MNPMCGQAESYVTITWKGFFHTVSRSFGLHGDFKDRIVDDLTLSLFTQVYNIRG